MRLSVLASGSAGNGYVLHNGSTAIVIEAGVPIKDLYKTYGYDVKNIAACLISHEHKDHCGFAEQYIKAGIPVLASKGTVEGMDLGELEYKASTLTEFEPKIVGEWSVTGFPTQHDGKQPFGFIVSHPETGNILFATDTYFLKYRFSNLNNILIECNYIPEVLDENVSSGKLHPLVKRRTLKSHMSLPTCIKTLSEHDLQKVVNIVLIHLSQGNSIPCEMKEQVALATGKRVFIAESGLSIDFNIDF